MRKSSASGLAVAAVLCGVIGLVGCGGNSVDPIISVTPTAANVTPGGQQQFFAHVDNAIDPVALYSVQGGAGAAGGTVNASGLYTAPVAATAGATDIILVQARDGSAPSVNVTVNIQPGVEVSPPSAEVSVRRTLTLTSIVSGDPDNETDWSVTGAGTIADVGPMGAQATYTAPDTATDGTAVTITGTSTKNPGRSDTATIILRSGSIPVGVN